jgi:hypothetical protein
MTHDFHGRKKSAPGGLFHVDARVFLATPFEQPDGVNGLCHEALARMREFNKARALCLD